MQVSSRFDHKHGLYVLHRWHLPIRRKAFGIRTGAVCTRHQVCGAQVRNSKHVSTTVSTCRRVTLGDSDISKGVTTQRRRKKNQFLAGQKWVKKDGCVVTKIRAHITGRVKTQESNPLSSHHQSNLRLCWVPWVRRSLQIGFSQVKSFYDELQGSLLNITWNKWIKFGLNSFTEYFNL